ncbi:hypothetical protein V6N13_037423 [Hibiscus sabdariffa]
MPHCFINIKLSDLTIEFHREKSAPYLYFRVGGAKKRSSKENFRLISTFRKTSRISFSSACLSFFMNLDGKGGGSAYGDCSGLGVEFSF